MERSKIPSSTSRKTRFGTPIAIGVYLDRKILGKNWYKDARKGIWLGAFAMIVYGFSVTDGTSKKKVKWASIKRNPQNNDKK